MNQRKGENDLRNNFIIFTKEFCRTGELNPRSPDYRSNKHPTELLGPARLQLADLLLVLQITL